NYVTQFLKKSTRITRAKTMNIFLDSLSILQTQFEFTPVFVGGISLGAALLALLCATILAVLVIIQPAGDEKMKEISAAIRQGAMAFLGFEYLLLTVFAVVLFILVSVLIDWRTGICYLLGA